MGSEQVRSLCTPLPMCTPRTQRLSAQVSSSTQQFQPCDYHRFVGLSLSILCEEREKEGQRPSKAEELVLALQQVVSKFSGSGDK